jgi:hypothetical protein
MVLQLPVKVGLGALRMTGIEGHPNASGIEGREALPWNKAIVLFRNWFGTAKQGFSRSNLRQFEMHIGRKGRKHCRNLHGLEQR